MMKLLLVGAGGFVGSILRYVMTGAVYRLFSQSPLFPYGTLAVNVLGCFVIGMLNSLAETRSLFQPELRLFVFFFFLGGFTTFSTFGYETFSLLRDGQHFSFWANILLHLVVGVFAVWLGHVVSRLI